MSLLVAKLGEKDTVSIATYASGTGVALEPTNGSKGDAIVAAIERVLADAGSPRTPDLGGRASTADLGRAIAQAL